MLHNINNTPEIILHLRTNLRALNAVNNQFTRYYCASVYKCLIIQVRLACSVLPLVANCSPPIRCSKNQLLYKPFLKSTATPVFPYSSLGFCFAISTWPPFVCVPPPHSCAQPPLQKQVMRRAGLRRSGGLRALAKASHKVLSSSCRYKLKLVARTTPACRARYPSAQPNVSAAALLSCFLNKQRTDTN